MHDEQVTGTHDTTQRGQTEKKQDMIEWVKENGRDTIDKSRWWTGADIQDMIDKTRWLLNADLFPKENMSMTSEMV